MRRLYLKIALFLAPLFLVWLALEVFYRQAPNNYSYKDQQLQKVAPDVQTLVMGDSHAFYGINPVYFKDPTFNLSNISQSLLTDELLLEKHIANLPALKTVFINISYFTLSAKDNALESNWRKYFYYHNMGITAPSISFWNPGVSIFITIIWELRRQVFLFGIHNAIVWRLYNVLISQWLWCKHIIKIIPS